MSILNISLHETSIIHIKISYRLCSSTLLLASSSIGDYLSCLFPIVQVDTQIFIYIRLNLHEMTWELFLLVHFAAVHKVLFHSMSSWLQKIEEL